MPGYRTVDEQGDYYADHIDEQEIYDWLTANAVDFAREVNDQWNEVQRQFRRDHPGYNMDGINAVRRAGSFGGIPMTYREALIEIERETRQLWRDIYRDSRRRYTADDSRYAASVATHDYHRWAMERLKEDRDLYEDSEP